MSYDHILQLCCDVLQAGPYFKLKAHNHFIFDFRSFEIIFYNTTKVFVQPNIMYFIRNIQIKKLSKSNMYFPIKLNYAN